MDENGSGFIEFARKGFITKGLKDYETQIWETTYPECTISKKNGFVLVCMGHHLIMFAWRSTHMRALK